MIELLPNLLDPFLNIFLGGEKGGERKTLKCVRVP